jgi:AcrR family transcriptional regulator
MSKSGVFAHFGSREDLQIAVLKAYEQRFVEDVLLPGLDAAARPAAAARDHGALARAHGVEAASGCIWISGATEYDDRPGRGARRAGRHGPLVAARAVACDPAGDSRPASSRRTPTRAETGLRAVRHRAGAAPRHPPAEQPRFAAAGAPRVF